MSLQLLEHTTLGEPITREGISLIPIFLPTGNGQQIDDSSVGVTIGETETPSVSSINITNTNPNPVLFVAGETVRGGQQDRTFNVSILVPAATALDCPVSCVERGRWSGSREFGRSRTYSPRRVRRATQSSVSRNVSRSGMKFSNQGQVWESVGYELSRLHTFSAASALREADSSIDDHEGISGAVSEIVAGGVLPSQCGVVVTHGERVVGCEVFATPELLAAHWEALVRGFFLDLPDKVDGEPSLANAEKFLRQFTTSPAQEAPGVGLGTEFHVSDDQLVGQALVWDDALVHASAFALAT